MNSRAPLVLAFLSGGLLSLMVLFNGQWAAHGTALFASWMAHGTGTVAAALFLILLRPSPHASATLSAPAPLWAYLGGLSGAVTVMLTSTTVNGLLALSGTLAIGLVGQAIYSVVADRYGWFGLPRRRIRPHEFTSLGLIISGSFLIIFSERVASW